VRRQRSHVAAAPGNQYDDRLRAVRWGRIDRRG
jgi:hypothetical protein